MTSERRYGSVVQLVEPEADPGDEEEEVELEKNAKAENELVVPVDLDTRANVLEGLPAVDLRRRGGGRVSDEDRSMGRREGGEVGLTRRRVQEM